MRAKPTQHQRHFDHRRQDAVQGVRDQRRNPTRTAFDVPRKTPGLALQMKAQAQRVQVSEYFERHRPHGALRHLGKDKLTQLGKHRRGEPQQAITDEQGRRDERHCARASCCRVGRGAYALHRIRSRHRGQTIDDRLENDRHPHIGNFRGHQTSEGKRHPPLPFPQVGQQGA